MRLRYLFLVSLGVCCGQMSLEGADGPHRGRIHDAEGMYARAAMMLEDRSIQNVSSVPAMLENCARAGHPRATLLLLDVYEGKYKGLAAQPEKAARLAYALATAKESHDESPAARTLRLEAMFRSALYCEKGYGRKKSAEDALKWMIIAAKGGYDKACVELARYLMSDRGHRAAPRLAMDLLRKQDAKNSKTPHLYFYLGYMYFNGLGLPHPDREKALHYYERGAALGDPGATNNLASMYERGIVVSRNTVKAQRLYRQAAAAGSREASVNMQRLGSKTGEEAGGQAVPYSQRIDNAALRVLSALPLPEHLRELLASRFRYEEKSVRHP